MKMTSHAIVRMNQRGFDQETIDLILKYGSCTPTRNGRIKIWLNRKGSQAVISGLKEDIKKVEKATDAHLIVDENYIITVCHTK